MALPPGRGGPFRPTRLGQWEVIAKIAGGGMSAVYLGRLADPAPDFPNVVALKIARHELRMDERMLAMFLEEGKLIARLIHPNIVRTLEVGGDAELDFIAMELMQGKTFAHIYDAITLREVRLSPEIVAWTAARIADALHCAHELADEAGRPLGLVHRDVNPANVFATFSGEVKLFDFGLAKVTAKDASGSHLLAGKLSYLSPEQIMQMPLDRRSDIFSLGTSLWELLTGRRLFRRDSDLDTVRAVQLGPIPDPRQVAPEIPEDLARIAKTALERNREHRYPNAAVLARELDAFVFQRSSASEVTARLAQLVDTLFPGEQKRQQGWLKPAVSSSRQMNAVMNAVAPASVSPMSGPLSRPTGATIAGLPPAPGGPGALPPRETTQVMANAPLRTRTPGAPSSSAPTPRSPFGEPVDTTPETPIQPLETLEPMEILEIGERDSLPGPITPRDGISTFASYHAFSEVIADDPTMASPATEREAGSRPYSQPPATPRAPSTPRGFTPATVDPTSATMAAAAPPASNEAAKVNERPRRPSIPPPLPTAAGGASELKPGTVRGWPAAGPARPGVPVPAPPPLPQRQRTGATTGAGLGPPPKVRAPSRPSSSEDLSRTDIEFTPPVPLTGNAAPTEESPALAPPRASFPPRPTKKPPVPLPSRSVRPGASVPPRPSVAPGITTPKKPVTDPPSSDTQIDRPPPPRKT